MDNVPEPIRDAGYALVGLAVLSFQRAVVLGRELSRDLPDLADAGRKAASVLRFAASTLRPR